MFDQLFTYPQVRGRHLNSPFLKERLDYLRHCAEQGYKLRTLRELARDLLRIQKLLGLAASSNAIAPAAIEAAVKRCVRPRTRHSSYRDERRKHILSRAVHWLRFLKRLRLPSVALPAYQSLKDDFTDYLRVQKGLSEQTLPARSRYVEDFLQGFFRNHHSLLQLKLADLEEAIARKGREDGYSRPSLRNYASALRTFVRYAESRGWCAQGMAAGVVSPRVYQGESLPRGPSWKDVQRLIATTEGDRPQDLRDRAVLLLLTVYSLRSGEVRALRLDNVDWERNLLFIPHTKPRRTEPYPLSPTVGEAIVRYLQRARPRSSYREIFLTLKAPIRPLQNSGVVWRIVAKRARALNPPVTPPGPHALRHAGATHLLEQGLALKEIGDHLGHRALNSTTRYARVNLTELREVANLSLGGLL
jgi:integrase/recombinase XerD